jgi:hypothetical protein
MPSHGITRPRPGLTGLLLVALASPLAARTTVHVPDDYPTIQQAIAAATNGWEILVRPGTYLENINFLGKRISVRSTDGPGSTIIDGSQPTDPEYGSVVTFQGTETEQSILEGFTLTGGIGLLQDKQWRRGGGIFIGGRTSPMPRPTIRNNVIVRNQAVNGGGVYCFYAFPTFTDCVIAENTASSGGGFWFRLDGPTPIERCEIRDNVATAYGGGVFAIVGPRITDTTLVGNRADVGGGAIFDTFPSTTAIRCSFLDNQAPQGGALYTYDLGGGFLMQGCRFLDNKAEDGGVLYADDSNSTSSTFESCLLARNRATRRGGAIYLGGSDNVVTLVACTVVQNEALEEGGAIFSAGARILSSIVWDNAPDALSTFDFTVVESSNLQGGFPRGQGNLDILPLFVDPSGDDDHLFSGSVCIDRGSNDHLPAGTCDLDGNPRIVDGDRQGTATIDMGCFEYQPQPYDGRLGGVNTRGGGVSRADVLLINGSPGGSERVVTVGADEQIRLDITAPPSRPAPLSSRHVVYAWLGEPDALAVSIQGRSGFFLGWTALPTIFSGGSPRPLRLWNTFGHAPVLGEPDFPSDEAPATLLLLPMGRPGSITATFQGLIEDDAAPNDHGVATTNAVVLRVDP